ncbi:hypothetical protein C8R47DRAFT_1206175 [Mycena vitilis]|nr:hypothetical protein C8R47DRAFT_1206175 [Mycena vitilis]
MFTNVLLVAVFASAPLFSAAAPAAVESTTVAANGTISTCGSLTPAAVDAIAGAASTVLSGLVSDTTAAGTTVSELVNNVAILAGALGTLGNVGTAVGGRLFHCAPLRYR